LPNIVYSLKNKYNSIHIVIMKASPGPAITEFNYNVKNVRITLKNFTKAC